MLETDFEITKITCHAFFFLVILDIDKSNQKNNSNLNEMQLIFTINISLCTRDLYGIKFMHRFQKRSVFILGLIMCW